MQPAQYTIRPVRPVELPLLPAIEQAAGQRFGGTSEDWIVDDEGMGLEGFEHWFTHGKIWVAVEAADRPVGFAVARTIDGAAFVHELDVHPQHAGHRLGARLIDAVSAWAKACGYPAVTLSTFAEIPWNAPYYRRLGFRDLQEDELGPGLRQVRAEEQEHGLDIAHRLCMMRPVD